MHELYELKEKLMDELKEYGSKNEMTAGTLDVVDKLAHTIKNLCKIIEEMEYSEEGGSYEGGGSYAQGGGGGRGGQGGGNRGGGGSSRASYAMARGRGRNARRDSMGRYSSDSEMMVSELRELMEDAPDQKTRMEFERFIRKLEQM